jgi:hypothetical protein
VDDSDGNIVQRKPSKIKGLDDMDALDDISPFFSGEEISL